VLSLPYTLTRLALIIDLKEQRLEQTPSPFLRTEIRSELEDLMKRLEAEYHEFLVASGQSHKAL